MKAVRHFFRLFVVAVFAAAIVGCAPTEKRKSTGEVIDDASITARVKTALIKDPDLSAAEINVDTYKGKVQLSGYVSDAEDVSKAASVARHINGVKSVTNDLHVKK